LLGLRRAVPLAGIAAVAMAASMLAACPAHAADGGTTSSTLTTELTQAEVLVTATASPAQSRYGQPVTVTGNVTYQPETAMSSPMEPLAGAVIEVHDGDNHWAKVATVTADANGNFSLRLPARPTDEWAIGLTSDEMELISDGGYANLTTTVSVPTKITGLSIQRAASGQVKAWACVSPAVAIPGVSLDAFDVAEGLMRFQYAASPRGPWRDMWNGGDTSFGTCGHGGLQVDTWAPTSLSHGYYRLRYLGGQTSQLPATNFLPSTSQVVHSRKLPW